MTDTENFPGSFSSDLYTYVTLTLNLFNLVTTVLQCSTTHCSNVLGRFPAKMLQDVNTNENHGDNKNISGEL